MVNTQVIEETTHSIKGLVHDIAPSDLVATGDRLGFYRALDMLGSLTADELAEFTDVEERLVHDWLHHEVAAGHLKYLPNCQRFVLTPQQAETIAALGGRVRSRM